ncbi:MAG: 2-C-methyl-D-erythritol 4-phosphate cytidylyltransferase, partial [Burkholderiaceae bacterium]|nr:2-C-methyl-D-erythritol 4-phosphate cytidylyltransferase [Burkholderiaceae bacterium]
IALSTNADDRVLVHDAARPCLGPSELARLLDQVGDDAAGGLLAMPVTDTLKRGAGGQVVATLQREGLWCAQTPQMFRIASLLAALEVAPIDGVTDEASAVERAGDSPMLVHGSATNIKVTTAEDLTLACAILATRHKAPTVNEG